MTAKEGVSHLPEFTGHPWILMKFFFCLSGNFVQKPFKLTNIDYF